MRIDLAYMESYRGSGTCDTGVQLINLTLSLTNTLLLNSSLLLNFGTFLLGNVPLMLLLGVSMRSSLSWGNWGRRGEIKWRGWFVL